MRMGYVITDNPAHYNITYFLFSEYHCHSISLRFSSSLHSRQPPLVNTPAPSCHPMTIRPGTRNRTRSGIRARRLSPCYRHPDESLTGICASCLRERLSGLEASDSPELRRCRSVSVSKCEASSSCLTEPRRNSCDVVSGRSSLSHLLDADDVKGSGFSCHAKVGSKNLGLSTVTYTLIDEKLSSDKIGISRCQHKLDAVDSDKEVEEGEFKTMKEYIDLEFHNKNKKSKHFTEMAGNFWEAASVLSKKFRKWGQKNKVSKTDDISKGKGKGVVSSDGNINLSEDGRKLGISRLDIGARRSCDTEPRYSVDAGRISFEEARASWDGYMIARTIPRLAPMLSVVENGIFGSMNRFENHRLSVDGQMHSIVEDESSFGASGSCQSNSDSSSSMRQSSFDRSSSVKSSGKKMMISEDLGVSPANVKMVITEKELKEWHLRSNRVDGLEKFGTISRNTAPIESNGNLNGPLKKSVRWHRVRSVLGIRPKSLENKFENFVRNVTDPSMDDTNEKQEKEAGGYLEEITGWKLPRSTSIVSSRNSCDAIGSNYRRSVDNGVGCALKRREDLWLDRNESAKYSSADLDDGIKPFYMTPLRTLRSGKTGNLKPQNLHTISGNVYQLN